MAPRVEFHPVKFKRELSGDAMCAWCEEVIGPRDTDWRYPTPYTITFRHRSHAMLFKLTFG